MHIITNIRIGRYLLYITVIGTQLAKVGKLMKTINCGKLVELNCLQLRVPTLHPHVWSPCDKCVGNIVNLTCRPRLTLLV